MEINKYELYKELFESYYVNKESADDILFFLYSLKIISKEIKTFFYYHIADYNIFNDIDKIYKINENIYYDDKLNKEIDLKNINEKFKLLKKTMNKNIEKFYNKSPYNLFLFSPYWKVISEYKKEISNKKCQLCNSEEFLNTHHNNYKNRGKEYKNLNDLIVLCNKCHSKFHTEVKNG